MIVVLTIAEDLHALDVQGHVRAAGYPECHIVECDRVAQHDCLSYAINYPLRDRIVTSEGESISVSAASVLWLRRTGAKQALRFPLENEDARSVVDNDCRGSLTGFFATHFRGKWISTPEATARASDKIGQLQAAHACGFRVPKTLVSQSRAAIEAFYEACAGRVVVKTVVGAAGRFLQTVPLEDPAAITDAALEAAPAIYQELVPGREHLRLNCFGDRSYAALIRTDDLDWRGNLNVPISSYVVTEKLHRKVRRVLDRLGLEMGIVDLKRVPDADPVWLEVNPQGQFLFLDAVTDLRLSERFAEYLLAEAGAVSSFAATLNA